MLNADEIHYYCWIKWYDKIFREYKTVEPDFHTYNLVCLFHGIRIWLKLCNHLKGPKVSFLALLLTSQMSKTYFLTQLRYMPAPCQWKVRMRTLTQWPSTTLCGLPLFGTCFSLVMKLLLGPVPLLSGQYHFQAIIILWGFSRFQSSHAICVYSWPNLVLEHNFTS